MARRFCGAAVLVALALSVPSIASAETTITIGSTTQPSGSSAHAGGASFATYTQKSSASYAVAVPAGGGKITQWSTNTAGASPGVQVQLVVLRPAGGTSYTIIALDSETLPNPLPASQLATFTLATPIPVNAGDKIGINLPGAGNAVVSWVGGTTPATDVGSVESTSPSSPPANGQTVGSITPDFVGYRVNVSAVIEQIDVGVTTSTAPASPSVGNLAVLQSTVMNHSTGPTAVTFTDTVPNGLTVSSAFAGGNGSCLVSGQTVTCTIPNMDAGSSVPVNVLVTPNATGSYTNHVSVAPPAGSVDLNPSDNSATATLTVFNTAPSACTVLKLRGTPAHVAKRVLRQLGCNVKVKRKRGHGVPRGSVLKTKPGPGTYQLRRKITLIVRK